MKKILAITAALALLSSSACYASIIPSKGAGQIGYTSVVLCNSLSLREEPDFGSEALQTLRSGDQIIVMETENGWSYCTLGDAEDSPKGWVKSDFVAVDPAWYKTTGSTAVYAWADTDAPKVALLDAGTSLPILRDDGDWIVVSLRGAAGWISNPDRSTESAVAAETDDASFPVYESDGTPAIYIHWVGGVTYEDEKGRTYIQKDNGYYCITDDTMYWE